MGYLQLSAVICVYLQLSAVICGYLRLSAVLVCAASIRMVVVLMLVRLWKAYVCTYIPSSHETDDNNKNKNDNDSNDNDDDNDDVQVDNNNNSDDDNMNDGNNKNANRSYEVRLKARTSTVKSLMRCVQRIHLLFFRDNTNKQGKQKVTDECFPRKRQK